MTVGLWCGLNMGTSRHAGGARLKPILPSQHTEGVKYAIRDIAIVADTLEAQGRELLELNIGDPIQHDFCTPPHVIEAIHQAMLRGETSYSRSAGTKPALEAIGREAKRKEIRHVQKIFVTSGASEGIELALTALLNFWDEKTSPST